MRHRKRDTQCKKCKEELPPNWFLGVCWGCLPEAQQYKIHDLFVSIDSLSGEWDSWRPEEIYWEDKYDCKLVRLEAA